MTKISRFTKHTGVTSVKQLVDGNFKFEFTGGNRESGYRYIKIFSVRPGRYFENIMIGCSLAPGFFSVGNTAVYELSGANYNSIVVQVFQKTNNQYEVSALVSADFGQIVSVPNFIIEISLNLSLAPF